MHLSKLPAGSRVFVDANVMVYFFLRVEPFAETCKDFFHRVANLEIEAFTGSWSPKPSRILGSNQEKLSTI